MASSMAHLDICSVYYVNKLRPACYEPPGSCFCCVAEMCGAQLGRLACGVNPLFLSLPLVVFGTVRWGEGVSGPGSKDQS